MVVAPVSLIAASMAASISTSLAPAALGLFFFRLLRAAGFAIHLSGIDALLDELLEQSHFRGIVKRFGRIHFRLHERRLDHPDGAQPGLFAVFMAATMSFVN